MLHCLLYDKPSFAGVTTKMTMSGLTVCSAGRHAIALLCNNFCRLRVEQFVGFCQDCVPAAAWMSGGLRCQIGLNRAESCIGPLTDCRTQQLCWEEAAWRHHCDVIMTRVLLEHDTSSNSLSSAIAAGLIIQPHSFESLIMRIAIW